MKRTLHIARPRACRRAGLALLPAFWIVVAFLLLNGCAMQMPEPAQSYVQEDYSRRIDRVFVVMHFPMRGDEAQTVSYLEEDLRRRFLQNQLNFEIVVDDQTLSGEEIGRRLENFRPDYVLTIRRTETYALDARLNDQQEDVMVWHTTIRHDLNRNTVELAGDIGRTLFLTMKHDGLL
ncbi:hypothetical protein GF324_12815 [bacterium]|nr:hypothetical protein [bacterium]